MPEALSLTEDTAATLLVLLFIMGVFVMPLVTRAHGFKWGAVVLAGLVLAFFAGGPILALDVGLVALAASLNMRGWWLLLVSFACILVLHVGVLLEPTLLDWALIIGAEGVLLLWGWQTSSSDPIDPASGAEAFDQRERRRRRTAAQDRAARAAFEQALGVDQPPMTKDQDSL